MKTLKTVVGFVLLATIALGDTHSASVNVTVDTRTAAVTSLTITGPDSVIGGNSATYLCTALYADGSQGDVSSLCTWSFVGTVPAGAQMYGPQLKTALTLFPESVQIRAAYQRLEGQKVSDPFMVNIAGGRLETMLGNVSANSTVAGVWDLNASAITIGDLGISQYQWYLDGVLLSGQTSSHLTAYRVTGATGSRKLRVEVTDDQNRTAVDEETVAFNKPVVPREPEFVYPATDPVDGKMYNSLGDEFFFHSDRKSVGLVILTHGLSSDGKKAWIQSLGLSIGDRLQVQEKKPVPNICLYDWKERSDPFGVADYNNVADKVIFGFLSKVPADTVLYLYNIALIQPFAITQGQRLVKWIRDEIDAGNIDPDAPIHLIGHSAGGFVMGECAFHLKKENIIQGVVQVTSLDTPYILGGDNDTRVFELAKENGANLRVERYYALAPGLGCFSPALTFFILPGGGFWESPLWSGKLWMVSAHEWVHDWYDDQTTSSPGYEQDGFYYSPFMNNGFHGVEFGQNAQAFARAADMPVSLASAIPDSPLTGFDTFGLVTLSNGLYQVTEEANAGLFKDIVLPVGAQSVKFNYRFATAGDGDYLVVYWGTNGMPRYIGSDLQLSGTGFMEGEASVNMFAGETNRLTFILVSRGQTNAVLELKDIALTLSDDPDYDGLTTSEETALGTDPLNADTDGDGLSDFDEVRTYLTDPLFTDSDEDGMSDSNEIQAGSDPNDPDSCFVVTSLKPLPTGGMRLTWQGKAGRHYRVNRCDKLGTGAYTTLATGVTGVEPLTSFDDTQGKTSAFYWVEQEP